MEGFKNSMKKKGNFEKDEGLKEKRGGVGRRKVPFHIPSIPRPQEQYNIVVNNLNRPFEHVWLERSEDGSRFVHPMEKLSVLDFVDGHARENVQANLQPIEHTPFKLVEGVNELKELATKLREVTEFAVDLEHNQYRSFQGLTCLMQISTRMEDFVIDTLKLRVQIGPYLREVFKDPSKRKVMHGADRDILWLQRDFGIYVCNLFDTGQASRMLQLERNSLEYLLHHFCGISANKEYQNADWRLRPLPDEMLKYAREDTHYLLHIYDLMKSRLLSTPDGNKESLLVEVCKRSKEICMQLYEKELLTDSSFLYIYGLQEARFNSQQLSIASGLYEWRDNVARTEDESTGYILSNKALLEIAREMPISSSKLRHLVKLKSPYAVRNLQPVIRIIQTSIQNASAFENLAELLKNGQQEATHEQFNQAVGYNSVSQPHVENPMACTISQKAVFHGSDKSRTFQGSAHVNTSFSAENRYAKAADRDQRNCQIVKVGKHQEQERLQRLPLPEVGCFFKLSNAAEKKNIEETENGRIKCSETIKPAIFPTFNIKKKAASGFGAGLGNPSSNKMSDHDGGYDNAKDKADIQIQQLKSSTLPFRSFSGVERLREPSPTPGQCFNYSYQGMLQRPKANEEQEAALLRSEVEKPSWSAGIPVTDGGGMKFGEQFPCHPENGSLQTFQARFDASRDPLSLTDTSSSLEECCPLKPFHQVAARQQIEPWEPQVGGTVGADELRTSSGSGEICDSKGSFFDPAHGQERTGMFLPTWWQQAFPPPVNRSTDHR